MADLLNENIPWVPLKVNYFFLNDADDKNLINRSWPANLKPLDLGFEARPNWPAKI